MSGSDFRTRTATLLAVICAVSLVGLGVLFVFGPEFEPTHSGDADTYSLSAVGHAALMDLLERRAVPTAVHRRPDVRPVPGRGVLLVLEPDPWLLDGGAGRESLRALVAGSEAVLLALPKWRPLLDGGTDPRARGVVPWDDADVLAPLRALGIDATLRRTYEAPGRGPTHDVYPEQPAFDHPYRQAVVSTRLAGLIDGPAGVMLGHCQVESTRVFVLADPDVLANHGLHRGDNAILVMRWIDELRSAGRVVFDETLHGYPPPDDSLMRELFRFPLVLVLLHLVLVVGLLLWAGLGRFGEAPAPPPPLEPGSGFLIRQTASLLRFGGHRDMALRRYVDDVARAVAERFHLPAALRGTALDARLDALGAGRARSGQWSDLKQRALGAAARGAGRSEITVLRAARELHTWKREMLDGTRVDSRDAQPVA